MSQSQLFDTHYSLQPIKTVVCICGFVFFSERAQINSSKQLAEVADESNMFQLFSFNTVWIRGSEPAFFAGAEATPGAEASKLSGVTKNIAGSEPLVWIDSLYRSPSI